MRRAGIHAEPVGGSGALAIADPDGNVLHLLDRVHRAGEHSADPGRRPVRVQHVTFSTAALEPMVDFYRALGLRLTDRMGEKFAWLRSNVEHHSIAAVATGRSGGLDHFSFDLDGWADFKVWADRVTDLGVPVQWGPGRHGPGNNLFLFFDDPDGNHIELSAEMERFFDARAEYPVRTWEDAATTVNLWGGQVPQWRTVGAERCALHPAGTVTRRSRRRSSTTSSSRSAASASSAPRPPLSCSPIHRWTSGAVCR